LLITCRIIQSASANFLEHQQRRDNNITRKKLPMLNKTASSSEAFVVGDQKVCLLPAESYKALQQTFWNNNNGGRLFKDRLVKIKINITNNDLKKTGE
jgi:hypothetical protein